MVRESVQCHQNGRADGRRQLSGSIWRLTNWLRGSKYAELVSVSLPTLPTEITSGKHLKDPHINISSTPIERYEERLRDEKERVQSAAFPVAARVTRRHVGVTANAQQEARKHNG